MIMSRRQAERVVPFLGVIPAQAGIQTGSKDVRGLRLDSRLRGNDTMDWVRELRGCINAAGNTRMSSHG